MASAHKTTQEEKVGHAPISLLFQPAKNHVEYENSWVCENFATVFVQ